MSSTETPAAETTSASERLVGALAGLWRAIQARTPDLPEVMFAIGSGTTGRRRTVKHGHFASRRWVRRDVGDEGEQHVHEVMIGGEGLVRGPADVLETMLHEAAHVLAETRGIADTSMGGRYHNQRFAALARELGLDVAEGGGSNGWNATSVPDTTAQLYTPQLQALAGALGVYRLPEPTRPPGSAPSGRLLKAQCGCPTPRNIWGARSTLETEEVTCSRCEQPFTLTG
jgi:hypothetical protein